MTYLTRRMLLQAPGLRLGEDARGPLSHGMAER